MAVPVRIRVSSAGLVLAMFGAATASLVGAPAAQAATFAAADLGCRGVQASGPRAEFMGAAFSSRTAAWFASGGIEL